MNVSKKIIKIRKDKPLWSNEKIAEKVKNAILNEIKLIQESKIDNFLEKRIDRYDKMGIFSKS